MSNDANLILVGVISAANGIKGDVVIRSFTSPVSNLGSLEIMDENQNPIKIKILRENSKKELICKFGDSTDRNYAESLKGKKIFSLKDKLPKTLEDEFYIEDLRNLPVRDMDGKNIGLISDVANYGAGDIIQIKFDSDDREEMFPFTKEIFPSVEKDHVVFKPVDIQ